MLFIAILAVCFVLAFFGLTICRLAARSDASDALALADWIAMTRLASETALSAGASEPLDENRADATYRQAG